MEAEIKNSVSQSIVIPEFIRCALRNSPFESEPETSLEESA